MRTVLHDLRGPFCPYDLHKGVPPDNSPRQQTGQVLSGSTYFQVTPDDLPRGPNRTERKPSPIPVQGPKTQGRTLTDIGTCGILPVPVEWRTDSYTQCRWRDWRWKSLFGNLPTLQERGRPA